MILFGSGTLSARDKNGKEIIFGILQGVEVNIGYSKKSLRGDNKLFPVKEFYTEGEFSGKADYAEIFADQFNMLIGSSVSGSATQKTITIDEDSKPTEFEMTLVNHTEKNTITMKFYNVSSPSLKFSFAEGDFVIPSFDWSATPSPNVLTPEGKKKICDIIVEEPLADEEPPVIVAITPADGENNVPVDKVIEVTFNEPIRIDTAVDKNNYILLDNVGNAVEIGTVTYDSELKKVSITPTNNLNETTEYEFIVGTGIKDVAGNNLESPQKIVFETGTVS